MTSQIDVDWRHYGDHELGTACLVDINDHREIHGQQTIRQTTETPQRLKRV